MSVHLWMGALLPVAAAALFVVAGVLVARRPVSTASRGPRLAFVAWWFSAGLILLLATAPTLLTLAGISDMRVYAAARYAISAPLAVGLFSLLYYLLYIYTGRRAAWKPLAAAYALFFLFSLYYLASSGDREFVTTTWSVRAVSQSPPPAWLRVAFGASVLLPIIAATIAYASLYGRTREPAQRRRIALVSGAFLLWFVPLLVAFVAGLTGAEWFPLLYQAPGVVAAAIVVWAYREREAPRAQS